jgi:hypothetical protein
MKQCDASQVVFFASVVRVIQEGRVLHMGKEEIYTKYLLENLMSETVGMTEVDKRTL